MYDLTTLFPDTIADLVNDMREWVKDCKWADIEDEDVDNMTDEELIRGIELNYAGGMDQFLIDCERI